MIDESKTQNLFNLFILQELLKFEVPDLKTKMATAKDVFDMNQMSKVLHERLKCQICEDTLTVGNYCWYKCSVNVNHEVCQDCKENNKKCCDSKVSKEHCKVTEELLMSETMQFKCVFEYYGCQVVSTESVMEVHMIECIYRPVLCPAACQEFVPICELLQHLKEKNEIVCDDKVNPKKITFTETEFEGSEQFSLAIREILFDSKTFFLHVVFNEKSKLLVCFVSMFGSLMEQNEAENYYYTLEFHGIDPNTKSTYSAPVNSLYDTDVTIFSKKCFTFGLKPFKSQFVDENRTFEYSVKIRNMKAEAKDEFEESGVSDNNE